jgi:hypothetical protein
MYRVASTPQPSAVFLPGLRHALVESVACARSGAVVRLVFNGEALATLQMVGVAVKEGFTAVTISNCLLKSYGEGCASMWRTAFLHHHRHYTPSGLAATAQRACKSIFRIG